MQEVQPDSESTLLEGAMRSGLQGQLYICKDESAV